MPKTQTSKPIEIKISTVVAVSAILRSLDHAELEAAMRHMTGGAADYFDNEFAVLDLSGCKPGLLPPDWAALIALFRSFNLNPVAVRGAAADWAESIVQSGLSIDTLAQPRQELRDEPAPAPAPPPAPAPAPAPAPVAAPAPQAVSTLIIDTPVRAGQRVYARGGDLVVTAIVNPGAELIADGSIHVYAPLRGRALAGASGDASARIFALSMEAELVSIAGTYRTFDGGLPAEVAKKAAQVRLAGDRIDVLSIRA